MLNRWSSEVAGGWECDGGVTVKYVAALVTCTPSRWHAARPATQPSCSILRVHLSAATLAVNAAP